MDSATSEGKGEKTVVAGRIASFLCYSRAGCPPVSVEDAMEERHGPELETSDPQSQVKDCMHYIFGCSLLFWFMACISLMTYVLLIYVNSNILILPHHWVLFSFLSSCILAYNARGNTARNKFSLLL